MEWSGTEAARVKGVFPRWLQTRCGVPWRKRVRGLPRAYTGRRFVSLVVVTPTAESASRFSVEKATVESTDATRERAGLNGPSRPYFQRR